jgi:IstB-like ATP binding protein
VGTGKSHLAQAIGQGDIHRGYRETHKLLDDLAEATIDGTRKESMEPFVSVPLLIIDDLDCSFLLPAWIVLMFNLPTTQASPRMEVWRKLKRYGTLQLESGGYLTPKQPANVGALRVVGGSMKLIRIPRPNEQRKVEQLL